MDITEVRITFGSAFALDRGLRPAQNSQLLFRPLIADFAQPRSWLFAGAVFRAGCTARLTRVVSGRSGGRRSAVAADFMRYFRGQVVTAQDRCCVREAPDIGVLSPKWALPPKTSTPTAIPAATSFAVLRLTLLKVRHLRSQDQTWHIVCIHSSAGQCLTEEQELPF
jgi:hypothetical protein